MAEYNPFAEFNPVFASFEASKPLPVKIQNTLFGDYTLPERYSLYNGNIIAPANTPETEEEFNMDYLNEMLNRHSEINPSYSSIDTNIGDRPRLAVKFFVDNGYTINQAKGIVGNLMHESGDITLTNISNIGDNGTSFGMALWHDTSKGVGRWTNLKKYAEKIGRSEKDFETQLNFILKELKDNLSWDKGLKATTTVKDATKWFMEKFENPAKKLANFSNRLKYANSIS